MKNYLDFKKIALVIISGLGLTGFNAIALFEEGFDSKEIGDNNICITYEKYLTIYGISKNLFGWFGAHSESALHIANGRNPKLIFGKKAIVLDKRDPHVAEKFYYVIRRLLPTGWESFHNETMKYRNITFKQHCPVRLKAPLKNMFNIQLNEEIEQILIASEISKELIVGFWQKDTWKKYFKIDDKTSDNDPKLKKFAVIDELLEAWRHAKEIKNVYEGQDLKVNREILALKKNFEKSKKLSRISHDTLGIIMQFVDPQTTIIPKK